MKGAREKGEGECTTERAICVFITDIFSIFFNMYNQT